jgi:hypothetical protein
MGTGNNDSLNALQQQQQAALTSGGKKIDAAFNNTFTPQYYQNLVQNYENQTMPQLDQQYRTTGQNLDYNLANRGLSKSSAAQNLGSSLKEELATQQQGVVNNAQTAEQTMQQNVASEQQQLYGQLQVSENPTQTAQNAANIAAQTAAPSTFAPIGNMFSNWTNMYLAGQTANTANTNTQLDVALLAPYLNQNTSNNSNPTNP